MPYRNGRVFADTSTTPHQGVSVSDVQSALELTTGDVGTLCGSASINKWSKKKPVRVAGVISPITDEQIKEAKYGFNIDAAYIKGDPNTIALRPSGSSTWAYMRPINGFPYRLSDFNGYYKYASCPIQVSQSFTKVTQDGTPEAASIAIDGEIGSIQTQYNVLVSDIFDINQYGDYRLTLAVVDTTENSERVLCYYFAPNTLNDETAMDNGNKTVTVTTIPSEANPVLNQTYDAVLMLTNKGNLSDNDCKKGVLPSAMTGVTAVSLELENGNNRFPFTYQSSDVTTLITWEVDELSIEPADRRGTGQGLSGTLEQYILNSLYVQYSVTGDNLQEVLTEMRNLQLKVKISIQGPHYYWSNGSPSSDFTSEYFTHVSNSATYDVTDWISLTTIIGTSNIPQTELFDLAQYAKYYINSQNRMYPIFLDSDGYTSASGSPTTIIVHVYYRIGQSGSGSQVIGEDGEISHIDDYIHIQPE